MPALSCNVYMRTLSFERSSVGELQRQGPRLAERSSEPQDLGACQFTFFVGTLHYAILGVFLLKFILNDFICST